MDEQSIQTLSHPDLLEAYCKMADQKRDLEEQLRNVKKNMEIADNRLREEYFEPQGLSSVRTAHGTVSIRTDTYVTPNHDFDREEAASRLARSTHFKHLVQRNYNAQSLAAAVREKVREVEHEMGDELLTLTPEERRSTLMQKAVGPNLAKVFDLVERHRLTFSSKRG